MADLLKLYRGTVEPTTCEAGGLYAIADLGVWMGDKDGNKKKIATAIDTTYGNATTGAAGLMSAADKLKLDGIAEGANNYTYTLPVATSSVLGGVKTGSNITNTSGTISLTKTNVTNALGYTPPTTNTTYEVATSSVAGLMSAADKAKLDKIEDEANKYTLPTASSTVLGGVTTSSTVTSTSGLTATPIISGVPYYKNTTYKAGTGITLSGTTFSNSGVRSVAEGSTDGTISVNTNGTTADISVKGLGSAAFTASTAYDSAGTGAAQAAAALASAKSYADTAAAEAAAEVKDELLGGAGTAYDTLLELSELITDNKDAIDALRDVAADKANTSDLTTHTSNTNIHITAAERTKWNGYANTNAFAVVKAGSATVNSNAVSDTLNFVGGNNVTITGNDSTNTVTITATDTTYSAATTSAAGLMSAADKAKLDGIAENANNYTYTLPTASSSILGGVKTTSTVTSTSGLTACPIISGVPYYKDTNTQYTLSSFGITATKDELNILDGVTATATELNVLDGITATVTELNYVDGVTSKIQDQLNAKQATITGGATTIASSNLTANRALISNSSGKVAVSTVTSTELGYLDGVTSAIQGQLDTKVPTSRTINGKALSADITLSASDVSADASGAANTALATAKTYTDTALTWTDL